ncbi:MAG: DUF1080 domain-containing protein [Cyclobacteriaceae bacterium]
MNYVLILLFSVLAIMNLGNTQQEKEDWQQLFNSRDLTGWDVKIAGLELNENFSNTFRVEDGMLRISYEDYQQFNDRYGHIYYETPFSYYKLRFDYRFVGDQLEGGAKWNVRNSGVMLHAQSAQSNELDQNFPVSVELQLLGGLGTGDRPTANVCTPGTFVELGDTVNYDHCVQSHSLTYDGDRWVHVEALVMGGEYMVFMVEGDTVLRFQKPKIGSGFTNNKQKERAWKNLGIIDRIDFWEAKSGTTLDAGYIALQAESHPIDFKNIELLNLCGCMDASAKNYKSYYIKEDPTSCKY